MNALRDLFPASLLFDEHECDDEYEYERHYQCLTATTTVPTVPTLLDMLLKAGEGGGVHVLFIILLVLLFLLLCSGIFFFYHRHHLREQKQRPLAPHLNISWTTTANRLFRLAGSYLRGSDAAATDAGNSVLQHIPFIVWLDPDWRILHKAVNQYREESVRALQTLSRNLEQVRTSEELRGFHKLKRRTSKSSSHYLLSDSLQQRLDRLADIYEADAVTLQDVILKPHAYTKVLLPPPPAVAAAVAATATAAVAATATATATTSDDDDDTTSDDEEDTGTPVSTSRAPPPPPPPNSISTIFTAETTGAAAAVPTGDAAYNQARQILAHLARDWSVAGCSVRQTLYPWCQDRLHRYSYYNINNSNSADNNSNSHTNRSVLVPGAGLGRLAWELAQDGWTVHALEASPVMAAAAASMIHWQPTNMDHDDDDDNDDDDDDDKKTARHSTIRIHPYAMDYFCNEVDAVNRYESVTVPDVHPGQALRGRQRGPSQSQRQRQQGSLSYTIGLFGSDPAPTTTSTLTSSTSATNHSIEQRYAAIVTCFFLDTATNIYDYLDTIASSLTTSGLWINVGPVQWHGNAIVSMTCADLRSVLESGGCWDILEWSVDSEPVPYRTSDDDDDDNAVKGPRTTNYDGFRPLRFVARKL